MAVGTTPALYAGFIFDGVNSRDMGVYVQDVQVFGAPERDVEMVSIPGRDGEFALDRGRFSNIGVSYTCALGAGAPADFNEAISDLRNWLASRVGYKRLEDEINTGEYRLAVFKDGLDVSTINKQTGTFEVSFSCMPQRWLKSGETPQAVTSGGAITNPTRFSARPLLEVYGYGAIEINGEALSINSSALGKVLLANSRKNGIFDWFVNVNLANTASLNVGDAITAEETKLRVYISIGAARELHVWNVSQTALNGTAGPTEKEFVDDHDAAVIFSFTPDTFAFGTPKTARLDVSGVLGYTITATGQTISKSFTLSLSVDYDGAAGMLFSFTATEDGQDMPLFDDETLGVSITTGGITGDSTKSAIGEPAYIDLDIGEAYKIEGGEIVGINNGVSLPGDLPTLEPGENAIEYDATITALNIVPRWWKV